MRALQPPSSPENVSPEQAAVLGAIGDITLQIMNSRYGGVSLEINDFWVNCIPDSRNPDDVESVQMIANNVLAAEGRKPVVSAAAVRRFIAFLQTD